MPAIISDTSCLILLDKIEALLLLQKLFGSISVTKIVADEFGKELPDWIQVHTLENENYMPCLPFYSGNFVQTPTSQHLLAVG